jgi:hypothetical protein
MREYRRPPAACPPDLSTQTGLNIRPRERCAHPLAAVEIESHRLHGFPKATVVPRDRRTAATPALASHRGQARLARDGAVPSQRRSLLSDNPNVNDCYRALRSDGFAVIEGPSQEVAEACAVAGALVAASQSEGGLPPLQVIGDFVLPPTRSRHARERDRAARVASARMSA